MLMKEEFFVSTNPHRNRSVVLVGPNTEQEMESKKQLTKIVSKFLDLGVLSSLENLKQQRKTLIDTTLVSRIELIFENCASVVDMKPFLNSHQTNTGRTNINMNANRTNTSENDNSANDENELMVEMEEDNQSGSQQLSDEESKDPELMID
jgi:hypothetical protein